MKLITAWISCLLVGSRCETVVLLQWLPQNAKLNHDKTMISGCKVKSFTSHKGPQCSPHLTLHSETMDTRLVHHVVCPFTPQPSLGHKICWWKNGQVDWLATWFNHLHLLGVWYSNCSGKEPNLSLNNATSNSTSKCSNISGLRYHNGCPCSYKRVNMPLPQSAVPL